MSGKMEALLQLDHDGLAEELESAHRELFNLRFQVSTSQLTDISELKKARRQIARIKTLIRTRELEEEGNVGISTEE
jgi:large subunit ribosomal protein L29